MASGYEWRVDMTRGSVPAWWRHVHQVSVHIAYVDEKELTGRLRSHVLIRVACSESTETIFADRRVVNIAWHQYTNTVHSIVGGG